MERSEIVLAALAAGEGKSHTPVQIQKLLFLIDREIPELVGGPHFNFEPYHYGPFDRNVYVELDELAEKDYLVVSGDRGWRTYQLTPEGQRIGKGLLEQLPIDTRSYVKKISRFVRQLSFSQLVSAIYKGFPEMRSRSVFQD